MSARRPPTGRAGIRPSVLVFFIFVNLAAVGAGYYAFKMRAPLRIRPVAAQDGKLEGMQLPDFSLVERSGRAVTRADFAGKPWIADFIYTNCPSQCPMMTAKMSMLQSSLPEIVHFASFSVDPQNDTPEALTAFASRFHAASDRWLFLTGDKRELEKIIAALRAPLAAEPDAHSTRLYLIGPEGSVRGLYDTSREDSIKNLLRDARQLSGVVS